MQSSFKLQFLCLLWLLWGQVHGQDIRPEFPEDFPTTTDATLTTTEARSEPDTEQPTTSVSTSAATTTTEVATTEVATTEVATGTPLTTTTTEANSYSTYAPPQYPTREPDLWDSNEAVNQICYLKEQYEQSAYRRFCAHISWRPVVNCYRCCYYGYSIFAGCSKVHSGRCNYIQYKNFNF